MDCLFLERPHVAELISVFALLSEHSLLDQELLINDFGALFVFEFGLEVLHIKLVRD